ncbi:MAG: ATP synthase F1 subunit gamma [Candidatus Saccharimonadales bacterium]
MASRQQIKRRIGSVKSTRQITRAMQLVAASKLRRAQEAVLGPREYSRVAREMLTVLRKLSAHEAVSPLFDERPVKNRLIIVVSSDRGLAGAYDSNVLRRLFQELQKDKAEGIKSSVICIGRKATQSVARVAGLNVLAAYQDFPDHPEASQLRPILNTVFEAFNTEEVDAIDILYTHFNSTVSQNIALQRLLPAGFEEEAGNPEMEYAEVEPSLEELVRSTVVRLLEVQIYQARLDSVAAEYSMRMIAMKNATDNAGDLIDDLTLEYNNARQAAITQELAEITGGAEALNG